MKKRKAGAKKYAPAFYTATKRKTKYNYLCWAFASPRLLAVIRSKSGASPGSLPCSVWVHEGPTWS